MKKIQVERVEIDDFRTDKINVYISKHRTVFTREFLPENLTTEACFIK